jgi:hypothetical protein
LPACATGQFSFLCRGSWAAIALAGLLLASSGCAAIKATQQPGKKDLTVLTPGTPRTRLICELGAPLWTEERDGATVDIFCFKQGYTKAVKAGRALVHGAADVATGGLWEVVGIPAESLADGKDVKVEVTYDDRRAVRSVDVIESHLAAPPLWPSAESRFETRRGRVAGRRAHHSRARRGRAGRRRTSRRPAAVLLTRRIPRFSAPRDPLRPSARPWCPPCPSG